MRTREDIEAFQEEDDHHTEVVELCIHSIARHCNNLAYRFHRDTVIEAIHTFADRLEYQTPEEMN